MIIRLFVLLTVSFLYGCTTPPRPHTSLNHVQTQAGAQVNAGAKIHALAFAAVLNTFNREPVMSLNRADDSQDMIDMERQRLSEWWSVNNREDLLRTLEWLRTEGHRSGFADLHGKFVATPLELIPGLVINGLPPETSTHQLGGKTLVGRPANEKEWSQRAVALAVRERRPVQRPSGMTPLITAWDLGRYMNMCIWGVRAHFLTEEEAWNYLLPMARLIQKSYNSWSQFADDYVLGRTYWSAAYMQEDRSRINAALKTLLSPEGVWTNMPWSAPLGDGPVADDPVANLLNPTVVVPVKNHP